MLKRRLVPTKSNSYFLFGPRGSGKTTFLQKMYSKKNALMIDLLDVQVFDQFLIDPSRFEKIIESPENVKKVIVLDEVQKLPKLLDIVQRQIQKNKRKFILTGSSSRRLKQKGMNLLAGRAWVYHLYPFSTFELGSRFNLKKVLERGGLPDAILVEDYLSAREYLNAYVGTYLQKEIQEEQWVRQLVPFRKFLAVAAQMNGKIINKSKIAKEIGVDDVTVANYFEILEDTMMGFILPSYNRSVRKAQKVAPKFYFIDPGIVRALNKTLTIEMLPQTSIWGDAFEHWVILDIIKNASYHRFDWSFSYLRTKEDVEIDLIIDRPGENKLLIEIKSKIKVDVNDVKSLESLGPDIDKKAQRWLLSNDPLEQMFGKTRALYWQKGLEILFKK